MSASVLYMSMSLDGYIAGPDDGPGNPGGDGFGDCTAVAAGSVPVTCADPSATAS